MLRNAGLADLNGGMAEVFLSVSTVFAETICTKGVKKEGTSCSPAQCAIMIISQRQRHLWTRRFPKKAVTCGLLQVSGAPTTAIIVIRHLPSASGAPGVHNQLKQAAGF